MENITLKPLIWHSVPNWENSFSATCPLTKRTFSLFQDTTKKWFVNVFVDGVWVEDIGGYLKDADAAYGIENRRNQHLKTFLQR